MRFYRGFTLNSSGIHRFLVEFKLGCETKTAKRDVERRKLMTILIDTPGEFANRNWVRFPAPGSPGQELWHFTGNAVFSFRGESEDHWRYEELIILPPESPVFSRFSQWAYMAAPSAIYNQGSANNAGWAVDSVNLYANPGR